MTLRSTPEELRPTVIFDDVAYTIAVGLSSTRVNGHNPVVQLTGCHDVALPQSTAPDRTDVFVEVDGRNSAHIELSRNNLYEAKQPAQISGDVSPNAVVMDGNASPGKQ